MKLVTFKDTKGENRTSRLQGDGVVDMNLASLELPTDMLTFIDNHEAYFAIIRALGIVELHHQIADIQLLTPLLNPRSFRDYIGFEMHMLNASRSFGHSVGEAWYEMPIFYFGTIYLMSQVIQTLTPSPSPVERGAFVRISPPLHGRGAGGEGLRL